MKSCLYVFRTLSKLGSHETVCLYAFRTVSKLESHETVSKDRDNCHVKMPEAHNKIIKFNQSLKIYENSIYLFRHIIPP